MAGLKETMDVLVAVEAECDAILKSCEDGTLSILDIRHQLPVISKAKEAFVNAKAVRDELKDLDEAEMTALYDQVVGLGEKVVMAFAALSTVLSAA